MKNKAYELMNNLKRKYIDFNSLAGSLANYCYIPHPELKENKEHLLKKFEVCIELRKLGYSFYTEVKSKDKKHIFDIVAFNDLTGEGIIAEIVNSESEKSKIKKINEFPIEFELIFVKINEEFKI